LALSDKDLGWAGASEGQPIQAWVFEKASLRM
jgi:hypothetical protein